MPQLSTRQQTRSPDQIVGKLLAVAFVLLALSAGVTIALVASAHLREAVGLPRVGGPAYAVGERVDVPPGAYAASHRTVLAFVRPTCQACLAARGTLRALSGDITAATDWRVVLLMPMDAAENREYALSCGLDPDAVVLVAPHRVRVSVVPTLLVVDQLGRIEFVREGVPAAGDAAAIRTLLRSDSRGSSR